jgi:hypothetical protein
MQPFSARNADRVPLSGPSILSNTGYSFSSSSLEFKPGCKLVKEVDEDCLVDIFD